jgi:hypothetical protein
MGSRRLVVAALLATSGVVGAAAATSSCVSDQSAVLVGGGDAGGPGEPCYGNGSCDPGLTCLSMVCVSLDGGSVPSDASASGNDASKDAGAGATDGAIGDGGADADRDASFDAASNCPAAPVLPSTSEPGPMCPFVDAGDGGVLTATCAASQLCCEYSSTYDSLCQSSCPNQGSLTPVEWQCDHASHCGGAKPCCLVGVEGGVAPAVNFDTVCLTYFGTHVGGTQCATTTCGAGQITLCAQDGDCGGGKCVPFKTKGKTLGVCSSVLDGG